MGGNHDENNTQTANELIADTLESVYAEEVGLHSAGIGEHHFSTLGVLSCAALVLTQALAGVVSGSLGKPGMTHSFARYIGRQYRGETACGSLHSRHPAFRRPSSICA